LSFTVPPSSDLVLFLVFARVYNSILPGLFWTTFHALPKLPHGRNETARAKRVDGDGGFKAAICGGALAARHACVSCCCKLPTFVYFFSSQPVLVFVFARAFNLSSPYKIWLNFLSEFLLNCGSNAGVMGLDSISRRRFSGSKIRPPCRFQDIKEISAY
jgi:hypothetical protein